jgi:hypothetical protein
MKLPFLIFLSTILLLSCNTNKPDTNESILDGHWLIAISMRDIGTIEAPFTIESYRRENGDYSFHAYSMKNVDRQLLGFWKSLMARWFSTGFKYGSLLHIEKGMLIHKDSIAGELASSMGNYYLNGTMHAGHISGKLSNEQHILVGTFEADKKTIEGPLRNYNAIIKNALDTTRHKLYDPALLSTKGWKDFEDNIKRIGKLCGDDATLVMAFFYYGHRYMPFSHYALLRDAVGRIPVDSNSQYATLLDKGNGICYLKISSFSGNANEIDKAFDSIASRGYTTLIVDLRDNTGGGIAAGMAFMRHIVADTSYGGILLTRKYFIHHTALPLPSQYPDYLHFSAANYDLLIKGISEYEGICLMAYPQAPAFRGKIYVLTNNNTASTCEPIVYWLKQQHAATVIGDTTAGAMLSAEKFPIEGGYSVFLPTAIYYTSDGYKIDGHGVAPDIKVNQAHALDTVLTLLYHK